MTKTIKETWKEEIYEIITHNETSECHSKLVALAESLISQVEALVRRETLKDMRIFFATKDWHGTGKAMVEDYTKTKDITL